MGDPFRSTHSAKPPVTVLIVDDDSSDRFSVKLSITRRWPTALVYEASSASEAIAHVTSAELPPDIIIVDYAMPDITGSELLAELKGLGIEKIAIGYTAHDDHLDELVDACARVAFSKGNKGAMLDYIQMRMKELGGK